MMHVRRSSDRGYADHGWLKTYHSFSFANYHDPRFMGWGNLLVINEDRIAPGTGFGTHGHRDMEIISYVVSGELAHKDSMGNEGRTEAGDVQVMSAGTGVVHAEYNLEPGVTTLFQIWIMPDRTGLPPSWGAKKFPKEKREAAFEVLASGRPADASSGALTINVDGAVMAATLAAGQSLTQPLAAGRAAYLVLARGAAKVNGVAARARDGLAIRAEDAITITASEDAELVMVEVADA